MKKLYPSQKIAAAVMLAIGLMLFIDHFGLRVKCNPQQIGVLRLKPHYVGWFASFRDGKAFIDGKWVPVTLNEDGSFRSFSHRLWPRFYLLEMKEWQRDMYADAK